MEEASSQTQTASCEGSVCDGDTWTFVERNEGAANTSNPEDTTDNLSEHGSDGSSIVVISMESSVMDDIHPLAHQDLEEIGCITDFGSNSGSADICANVDEEEARERVAEESFPDENLLLDECIACDKAFIRSQVLEDMAVEMESSVELITWPKDNQLEENSSVEEDGSRKSGLENVNQTDCDKNNKEIKEIDDLGSLAPENAAMGSQEDIDPEPAAGEIPKSLGNNDGSQEGDEKCLSSAATNPIIEEPSEETKVTVDILDEESSRSQTEEETHQLNQGIEEPFIPINSEGSSFQNDDPEVEEQQIDGENVNLNESSTNCSVEDEALPEVADEVDVPENWELADRIVDNPQESSQISDELESNERPLATCDPVNDEILPLNVSSNPVRAEELNHIEAVEDIIENDEHNQGNSSDSESSDASDADEEETWELNVAAGSADSSNESTPRRHVTTGHFYVAKPDLLEEANRIEELDQMDYSSLTNQELPADLNLSDTSRERHYVHHPNQRLNWLLSLVVAFSLAGVMGFGLGHFIGLSDNFPPRPGCTLFQSDELHGSTDRFEGWTEADWRMELQRIQTANEALSQALKSQLATCQSQRQNDLITENWDLKHIIGRIRYGRPVRSIEDRDTINRLETENQELRTQVGKLRYRCVQPVDTANAPAANAEDSTHSQAKDPTLWSSAVSNMTSFWNHLIAEHVGGVNMTQHLTERLHHLKKSAADLVDVIETRWQELGNMTLLTNHKVTLKMKETLQKSAQKVIDLASEMFDHPQKRNADAQDQKVWTDHVERIKTKLEKRWEELKRKMNPGHPSQPKASKENSEKEELEDDGRSLNADWFLLMGRQRDKMRKNQRKTDWLFERAKSREQDRYSKKKQPASSAEKESQKEKAKYKNRRQDNDFFQENQWNYFSA